MDYTPHLKKILSLAVEEQASDLLISAGSKPMVRITGTLAPLATEKKLNTEETKGLAFALMNDAKREKFLKDQEIDFSYDFEGKARFRVNAFFQRQSISIALRLIPSEIRNIEALKLPSVLHEFTKRASGLVLITGPSGHGKSTTMAALIDEINHTKEAHIITIEDPIEYIFTNDRSLIEQREILSDTANFSIALRASFRQNPDVIMVGEMRDLETIATALTAAETGHLVFATLHTSSAAQSVHRIIDVFPAEQQNQIRFQLAGSLVGVVSKRLVPRVAGGFAPACEIMINTTAVANLIRENKTHEIGTIIESSAQEGMISLNRSLADLVARNEISLKDALDHSPNPLELKNFV